MYVLVVTITVIMFLCAILMVIVTSFEKKSFRILSEEKIYRDTKKTPGALLFSSSLPLKGKPDYLLRTKEGIIPVEIKTGKTPLLPYENHIMQLMAYCFLVQENYHKRPVGGYIWYPEREFHILYTKEAEESVKDLVQEIIDARIQNNEPACTHTQHQIV